MKKLIVVIAISFLPYSVRADFWGGDLPLLVQIVTNTMNTLMELKSQTSLLEDEMEGIKDKIYRIQTIAEVIQPSTWERWKDPKEALSRLRTIYHTLPKEYRSEKSDAIEGELSRAMNLIARISGDAHTTFLSGKELERRGADTSPGVATKLTASGVGTLITMEAQSQIIQSHVTSLLAQMLADANERESRSVVSKATGLNEVSGNLGRRDGGWFSAYVMPIGLGR